MQATLADYQKQYPKIVIQLFLKNEYVDLVREGYDLAIRVAPLNTSSLIAKKIDTIAYHCVASADYLSMHPALQKPEDLQFHHCIALATSPGSIVWKLSHPAGDCSVQLDPVFIVNDPIYALQMAKSGLGIAYLPDFIVKNDIACGTLQDVLPTWQARYRDIYAVYHNRTLMPLALRKLLVLLNKQYEADSNNTID